VPDLEVVVRQVLGQWKPVEVSTLMNRNPDSPREFYLPESPLYFPEPQLAPFEVDRLVCTEPPGMFDLSAGQIYHCSSFSRLVPVLHSATGHLGNGFWSCPGYISD
jgi:hypothetical protein